MSTQFILITAILVFTLMVIGLVLTMIEFRNLADEPSRKKQASGQDRSDTARVN